MIKKWLQKATDAVASIQNSNTRVIDDVEAVIGIEAAQETLAQSRAEPTARTLDLIVVPQSALDGLDDAPYLLCDAVVLYANYLMTVGHFSSEDMPPEIMQIAHVSDYYTQVCNGGHTQFVGHSRENLSAVMQDVMSGVMEMGHDKFHKIVSDMATWVAKNPIDTESQYGAATALSDLDAPFHALDKEEPFQSLLADWIAGLEIVLAVPDDQLDRIYEGVVMTNAKSEPRGAAHDIERFDHMLSDPLHLGLAHAGGSVKDPLIAISASKSMEVQGKEMTCWPVASTGGKRWGVINETGAALLDAVQGDDGEHAGNLVASVSREQINVARQIAAQTKAAVAIDLLLSKVDRKLDVDCLSVRSAGRGKDNLIGTSIYVVVNKATEAFTVLVTTEGAKLLEEPTHNVAAAVTSAEIAAHAAKFTLAEAA